MELLKADLHIHSSFSYDSKASPLDILHHAKQQKLDVISITDHNTTAGSKEAHKLAKRFDILVVIGQEVKTQQGELLIYNVNKDIPSGFDIKETCELVKKAGGSIIPAHPFDRFRSGAGKHLPSILTYIDAIEGFNTKNPFHVFNKNAMDFARRHKLAYIANSDAHIVQEIGNSYTLVKAKKTPSDIFRAIQSHNIELVMNKISLKNRIKSTLQKV